MQLQVPLSAPGIYDIPWEPGVYTMSAWARVFAIPDVADTTPIVASFSLSPLTPQTSPLVLKLPVYDMSFNYPVLSIGLAMPQLIYVAERQLKFSLDATGFLGTVEAVLVIAADRVG